MSKIVPITPVQAGILRGIGALLEVQEAIRSEQVDYLVHAINKQLVKFALEGHRGQVFAPQVDAGREIDEEVLLAAVEVFKTAGWSAVEGRSWTVSEDDFPFAPYTYKFNFMLPRLSEGQ